MNCDFDDSNELDALPRSDGDALVDEGQKSRHMRRLPFAHIRPPL